MTPQEERAREILEKYFYPGWLTSRERTTETIIKAMLEFASTEEKEMESEDDDIYDSICMEVVEVVEKDNIQCEAYKATAEKLKKSFTIKRK